MIMRPTWVEIDLASIRHNVRQIIDRVGPAVKLIAVVKADGYGHGAAEVSRAALQSGAACLAVALPEEGAKLRAAGFTVPIFILGLTLPEQAAFVVANDLIAAVCTEENILALDAAAHLLKRRARVMIKLETGMGRIGITPDGLENLLQYACDCADLEPVGIFTHLAAADASDKTYALRQLDLFRSTTANCGCSVNYLSAANSAAIIDLPEGNFNAVRPGIILYGLPPSGEMHTSLDLQPAMQFKTRIVHIKHVPAGTSISYGCTYTTSRPTYIATLPVGYADGYSRLLSNKSQVLISGRRHPVIGRVCMDQTLVDLGPVSDAMVGDEVVLFGRQGQAEITVTELADLVGTINYELVCAVSNRVPRVYLNE
jgi:alanine racemase